VFGNLKKLEVKYNGRSSVIHRNDHNRSAALHSPESSISRPHC